MIRFIDKAEGKPGDSSEFIGRFVGKAGVMHSRGYLRPMKVVRCSGSRLYGVASEMAEIARGEDWRFASVEAWNEACHLDIRSVAYVCDTVEECEALIAASRRALLKWTQGVERLKNEIDRDFDMIVEEFSVRPSAAP